LSASCKIDRKARKGDLVLFCVKRTSGTPLVTTSAVTTYAFTLWQIAMVSSTDRGGAIVTATGKDGRRFERNGRKGTAWLNANLASADRLTVPVDLVVQAGPESWDTRDEAMNFLRAYVKD